MGKLAEMTPVSEPGLVGRRVLVADDEAAIRWAYVARLRAAGARVVEARDGLEALDLVRAERPDLILVDAKMPRLDGLELCEALRREPDAEEIPVVLLSDGEPPQAVWSGNGDLDGLIDTVLAVIASPPEPPEDPVERENLRAQSAVAMHRDPANHVVHPLEVAWRLRTSGAPEADGSVSGFGAELHVMSRIFGAALIALVLATAALIAWRLAVSATRSEVPPAVVRAPEQAAEPPGPTEPARSTPPAPPTAAPREGLTAFSGELRPGVDVEIVAAAGQGALVLDGPEQIRASVDGIDRGALPISLVLDEGRHVVRYRLGDRISARFYFVKAGATRMLRVITQPGGFVDAR